MTRAAAGEGTTAMKQTLVNAGIATVILAWIVGLLLLFKAYPLAALIVGFWIMLFGLVSLGRSR